MRRVLAFLFCLLAVPSWALSPAQEILLLGGGGNSFYANPAATSVVPSWLSYASAGVRYYFDAAGNLQTSPNNLILNSVVFATQTVAVTSGASYILSATMASGSSIAATGAATSTLNGSGGGTRVFVSFVASSASVTLTLTGAAAQSQLEQVTAAQTTPNPFMPTSGSAYYGPVVNDHNPATLAALGLRNEPQRTNLFLNNLSPATQIITVTSGTTYTMSFYGAGSVVLSGAATQTMMGTAGVRTQYSFTASTTSLVATVSGLSATSYAQAEANSFATSPILTYGAAVTVPTDNWSFTGAALRQLTSMQGCVALEVLAEGINTNQYLLSIKSNDNLNNTILFMNSPTAEYFTGTTAGVSWGSFGRVGGDITTAKRRVALSWQNGLQSFSYDGSSAVSEHETILPGRTTATIQTGNTNVWISQIMIRPPCTAQQVQGYSTANSNMSH